MGLHSCPGCTILQDISFIDLPTHFSIYRFQGFTSKIGGYFSFDWSHALFTTTYRTKVVIREDPMARSHIDPYMSIPINMNHTFHEEEECMISKTTTLLKEVPSYSLDDWDNAFQFDSLLRKHALALIAFMRRILPFLIS